MGEGQPLPQVYSVSDRRRRVGGIEVLIGTAIEAVLQVGRHQRDSVNRRVDGTTLGHRWAAHIDIEGRLARAGAGAEGNDAHGVGARGQAVDVAA